jgi:hypothetical protein
MDESAHTPSMASITLSTNLSDQPEPRLAILDWKISIQEAVHVTGAPLGGDMNHLHSSLTHGDTEYASHAYNYGTQGADPAVPPVLLPRRLPEEIGEYAGPATAANAAAITLHHARVARNAALASFMLKLWLAVMHSLGDDNRAMIRDPVTGFGGFSLRDVVGLIEATYGGTTISTLAVAISRVSTHVYVGDSVQDFNNHSANITRAFRTLEALNNGAAEGTKLVHFMQSIGQNTAALGGANAYINEVPDLSNQTMAAMITRIRTYLASNAHAGGNGTAFGAAQQAPPTGLTAQQVQQMIQDGLQAHAAGQGAAPAAALNAAQPATLPRSRPPTAPPAPRTNTSQYCFYHGKCDHKGTICRVLNEKGHWTTGLPFTRAMKEATNSRTGGSTF